MIVRRSMHDTYLSNSYLVADQEGGSAVIIDTGAPIEPLLAAVSDLDLTVTHIFNTHDHHDHTTFNVELQERFDAPLLEPGNLEDGQRVQSGDLSIVALATPGHTQEHFALLVNDEACFTGDALFAGSVGGTLAGGPEGYADLRRSIMDVLMTLAPDVRLYPGHAEPTTVAGELRGNPFVRMWKGIDPEGAEPVKVAGHECTMLVWAGDYDGGNKACVRFPDGREAIVGGSSVTRPTRA